MVSFCLISTVGLSNIIPCLWYISITVSSVGLSSNCRHTTLVPHMPQMSCKSHFTHFHNYIFSVAMMDLSLNNNIVYFARTGFHLLCHNVALCSDCLGETITFLLLAGHTLDALLLRCQIHTLS